MASQSLYKNSSIHLEAQQPQVLQDRYELLGILDSVELAGDGLVQIRVAGQERRVAEELEGQLRALVGKKTSIMRVGDCWSAVEVINHV